MHRTALGAALAAVALSVAVSAQSPYLNELYVSHAGTDDQEFVEIVGTPGASLDGLMLLVVEGEPTQNGILDRAADLSGHLFPADGHFVVGGDAVANVDVALGATNLYENGTETFYLLAATDVSAVTALVGTSVVAAGSTTVIPTLGSILDSVALTDLGTGDVVYDGATTLGPDGTFFPAGAFRPLDDASQWCGFFLDFDDDVNATLPRTPGVLNVPCASPTPLRADTVAISLAAGGTAGFFLDAGTSSAGLTYWLIGSVSGTSPGLPVGGITLPLNFDEYMLITINEPNGPLTPGSLGLLDGSGQGTASLIVPAGLSGSLAGLTVCHAFAVIDFGTLKAVAASNAWCITLLP